MCRRILCFDAYSQVSITSEIDFGWDSLIWDWLVSPRRWQILLPHKLRHFRNKIPTITPKTLSDLQNEAQKKSPENKMSNKVSGLPDICVFFPTNVEMFLVG